MSPISEIESTIRFQATLEEGAVAVPDEVKEAGMVEGTFAGFPFRAPLEDGRIKLSQALQNAVGVKDGQAVTLELTRFGDEPEVRVPADFREAIENCEGARDLWPDITPMARREWVRWIASAKQATTREKRIGVGLDKLSKGMRRPCCFPGLNWVTKDLVAPEETWVALPSGKKGAS